MARRSTSDHMSIHYKLLQAVSQEQVDLLRYYGKWLSLKHVLGCYFQAISLIQPRSLCSDPGRRLNPSWIWDAEPSTLTSTNIIGKSFRRWVAMLSIRVPFVLKMIEISWWATSSSIPQKSGCNIGPPPVIRAFETPNSNIWSTSRLCSESSTLLDDLCHLANNARSWDYSQR